LIICLGCPGSSRFAKLKAGVSNVLGRRLTPDLSGSTVAGKLTNSTLKRLVRETSSLHYDVQAIQKKAMLPFSGLYTADQYFVCKSVAALLCFRQLMHFLGRIKKRSSRHYPTDNCRKINEKE